MAFRAALRPLTTVPGTSDSFGLGCAPIGNLYTAVAEEAAEATVSRALERGIRFFDTAPHYGEGVSELRLGRALADVDRDTVVVATKVGRRVVDVEGAFAPLGASGATTVADLSREGVLRSFEASLARLRTDRVDLLYLHDPQDLDLSLREAIPALVRLREEGVVRAIGVGMGHNAPLTRFVEEADIDVVMVAGRLTLLDDSARDALLPAARRHGVGVITAGVFNSGILADPIGSPYFDYHPATDELVQRARTLDELARTHATSLRHAAAQYPLRHEPVEAVVVGARTPAEVDDFADGIDAAITPDVWKDLDAA